MAALNIRRTPLERAEYAIIVSTRISDDPGADTETTAEDFWPE